MFLLKDRIHNLNENQIIQLCKIANLSKLRNVVVSYHKNANTKNKPYGKNSKEWKNENNEKPSIGFIENFFIYQFKEREEIDDDVLSSFETKLFKTILGKEDYKNPTEELLLNAVFDREGEECDLLRCVFGYDIDDDEEKEEVETVEEESEKQVPQVKEDSVVKRIDTAVAKQKKEDKKELDKVKKALKEAIEEKEAAEKEKERFEASFHQLKEELDVLKESHEQLSSRYDNLKKKLSDMIKGEEPSFDEKDFYPDEGNVYELLDLIQQEVKKGRYSKANETLIKTYITIGLLGGYRK